MLYRILAILALFFFTACGGGEGPASLEPQGRKAVNPYGAPERMPGMATPAQPVAPDVKVVKIGLLVPLSGEASAIGAALQDSATLALMDKYGYAENGANKVKVVLVPKDTGGNPAGAAAAAQQVLASGAQLIVGPLFSQNVPAVAPIAKRYGVNVLTFSNNPEVAGDNVFVFGFQIDQQVKRILNYALDHGLRNVALLAPNNASGAIVKQGAGRLMQSSGLSLASEQYYNPVGDAGAETAALAAQNALTPVDAVLLPEGGQKLESIVRALRAQGLTDVRFLGTGLWDEPVILRSGTLTGGWFASSPPDRFAAYERRFRDFFGYAPPRISALAYDAMALAASLAMSHPENGFGAAMLADPVGYNGPVNGIFRCDQGNICERGLAVLEVTGRGTARVLDSAPESF